MTLADADRSEDRAALELRLGRVLDFAATVLDKLAAEGTGEGPARILPEKVIAETALLALAAWAARTGEENGRRLDRLTEALAPWARGKRALAGLCFEPALALDFATAHICLTRLGSEDTRFDEALQRALASQAARAKERPPHRILEQEWLRSGPRTADGKAMRRAVRLSALAHPLDLLSGSVDDVYAFTHAMMYVTDFGLRRVRMPRPRRDILLDAEDALGRCLDEDNYDLGGEVLLAWPLLRASWSPEASFGFRVLLRAEDIHGCLPAPGLGRAQREELAGESPGPGALGAGYHTIYVMGLLCAAALNGRPLPPAGATPRRTTRGAAERMLRWIVSRAEPRLWRVEFDRLPAPRRDALAGMVFSVALRQRTRQRDVKGMVELLAEAHALGLTDRPIASQAAETLDRARVFSAT